MRRHLPVVDKIAYVHHELRIRICLKCVVHRFAPQSVGIISAYRALAVAENEEFESARVLAGR